MNLEKRREQAVVFFLLFLFRGLSVKEARGGGGGKKVGTELLLDMKK